MLELTPIPAIFAPVIFWHYEDSEVQSVFVSGCAYETREEAEAQIPNLLDIWSRNGRVGVMVHVHEFAPIPF